MTDDQQMASGSAPVSPANRISWTSRLLHPWRSLRAPISWWMALLLGTTCIVLCFGVWFVLTYGEAEERILGPVKLPSPEETFASFKSLWFERALTRNTLVTLRRVTLGFSLAIIIGIPLGILAGCFTPIASFLAPIMTFGRNAPIVALIPLTMIWFGIAERQKVMIIFIACVAFVISDAATAVGNVARRYIDTAYTLGASRRQVILKVLTPLALPSMFNSARLLFGLAFGYIMVAEMIKLSDEEGGLGYMIIMSERRGLREHIYLLLLIIPMIAFVMDRGLFWIQRELFPYRYASRGILNQLVRFLMHRWEDLKSLFIKPHLPEDLNSASS